MPPLSGSISISADYIMATSIENSEIVTNASRSKDATELILNDNLTITGSAKANAISAFSGDEVLIDSNAAVAGELSENIIVAEAGEHVTVDKSLLVAGELSVNTIAPKPASE